jgi:pyrroloquinoline quinone (PQQ) biosynthesis protein C
MNLRNFLDFDQVRMAMWHRPARRIEINLSGRRRRNSLDPVDSSDRVRTFINIVRLFGTESVPNFFMNLVLHTDEARREFETHPVALDAIANGLSAERYRKLLLELYPIVWHFNPICGAAASRIEDSHRKVRYFLYEHMQEESGHEEWVSNDLQAIGVSSGEAAAHRPTTSTLTLVGYNYWTADRQNPCSVLGMLYALEVIASVYGGSFAESVRDSLLLTDDRGVSFIGSHATMDAEHMAQLRHVLNTVEDDATQRSIVDSTLVNFEMVTRIFADI